jgi:predicted small metal-binding protein
MSILVIDGVKYEAWAPTNEDEFVRMVEEHAKDIFGEQSIYLDIKHKLKSKSGIGSIPDGYVIVFGDEPHWHIVEVELSTHPLYEHIVPQISKFINGIKNPSTQRDIVDTLYREIDSDDFLKLHLKKAMGTTETYKFLSDLVSKPPIVTIIIEKHTEQLDEVIQALAHPQIKIVEFQTFTREGVGLNVHVHLFEPLYKPHEGQRGKLIRGTKAEEGKTKAKKVTFQELEKTGLAKGGQILRFYHTRLFDNEQAQIVTSSNELEYKADGKLYSASELAKKLLIKHGFKHDEHPVAGPKYWKTEDGKLLDDLNEQIRSRRGDRT